ncbi:MAG: type II secretion system minor pseudopilin GspK [Desulfatibacillum sp.]|nr:type II secretion system minor pseudopilin GspK [Desulfatibacillum sp.]
MKFFLHKPGHKGKEQKNQSGVALLMTLAVVALLVAVTVELHHRVRASVFSTEATRTRRQLDWTAQSGIALGMAMLVHDKKINTLDSTQDDWANQDKIKEMLADFDFPQGKVELEIKDLTGLIQVNALVKSPNGQQFNTAQNELWDRFLRPIASLYEELDVNATTDIINSMKDWIDSQDDDAITGLNGAETDYYQGLDTPYNAKNNYFNSVSELLRVKGITPELFYGSEEIPGIWESITVYGADPAKKNPVEYPGKINMGTAPLGVLRAMMPVGSEDLAESILEYREDREEDYFINPITEANWYLNAPGCADLKIDQGILTSISDYFEITCTATFQEIKKVAKVVVLRNKAKNSQDHTCEILAWHSL